MKTLLELSNSLHSFIHTREGAMVFTILFALIILFVGKLKNKIKEFLKWRKWKKLNKMVKKQDKRRGHIVYKNTRDEFLKKRKDSLSSK